MQKYTAADIAEVKYTNKDKTHVQITFKKEDLTVKSNLANRYFMQVKEWVSKGNKIKEYNPTPKELAGIKRREITKAFHLAAKQLIKYNGVLWQGGIDSYMKLVSVIQLAKDSGLMGVQLFDAEGMPHTMSIKDGVKLTTLIGKKYQKDFTKKKELLFELKDCSVDRLNQIKW